MPASFEYQGLDHETPDVPKTCTRCKETKTNADFGWRAKSHGRKRLSVCLVCNRALNKEYRYLNREKCCEQLRLYARERREFLRDNPGCRFTAKSNVIVHGPTVVCSMCGIEKDRSAFQDIVLVRYKNKPSCKVCLNAKRLEQYHRDKDKPDFRRRVRAVRKRERDSRLRTEYGITSADVEKMLAAQNNLCALCGQDISEVHPVRGYKAAVDHCHNTGTVRGLLCSPCNTGLGIYEKLKANPRTEVYLTNPPAVAVIGEKSNGRPPLSA